MLPWEYNGQQMDASFYVAEATGPCHPGPPELQEPNAGDPALYHRSQRDANEHSTRYVN